MVDPTVIRYSDFGIKMNFHRRAIVLAAERTHTRLLSGQCKSASLQCLLDHNNNIKCKKKVKTHFQQELIAQF
jgi:hypothetical protein